MLPSTSETKAFLPGERVPQTGVYECKHSDRHTAAKELIFESGKKFPLCSTCFWSVRYFLVADCVPDDMDAMKRKRNEASIRAMSA
jgi:hypothetical protein